jgi:hypothetical protein
MNVSEVSRVGSASAEMATNTTIVTLVATNQLSVLMFSSMEMDCPLCAQIIRNEIALWLICGECEVIPFRATSEWRVTRPVQHELAIFCVDQFHYANRQSS